MADIVDVKSLLLITLATEFKNYPVYLQGSMSDTEAYPQSFFTYWNNDTSDSAFYDNSESETIWDFDLNFYSSDPTTVNTTLITAKSALRAVGFICQGAGYDVVSDEKTHTGRGMNISFIQKIK